MRIITTILVAFFTLPAFATERVSISSDSFNPTLHEHITYTVKVDERGTLTARILDRDTYVTKTLASNKPVTPGTVLFTWDGTDNNGQVVPDESWSVRVDFRGAHDWTYFPASTPSSMASIVPDFFDRTSGVLRYTLPSASRVHLQAGIADRSTKESTAGAVMKTIVNRAPRPAGAVIEQWTGMDESGTIYVPSLQNFVVAIAATPLPEQSVITYGNRNRDFLTTALERSGAPLLMHDMHASHAHHQGLTAVDDATPRLTTTLRGAHWDQARRAWQTGRSISANIQLKGPTAVHFAQQPSRLVVYVDQNKVLDRPMGEARDFAITLPRGSEHVVAVNWVSAYGPVAATAFRTVAN